MNVGTENGEDGCSQEVSRLPLPLSSLPKPRGSRFSVLPGRFFGKERLSLSVFLSTPQSSSTSSLSSRSYLTVANSFVEKTRTGFLVFALWFGSQAEAS